MTNTQSNRRVTISCISCFLAFEIRRLKRLGPDIVDFILLFVSIPRPDRQTRLQ